MKRGFGWKPESKDPDRCLHELKLRSGTLPDDVNFWDDRIVFDQGGSSSCPAQAVSQGVRVRLVKQGEMDPPWPSRRYVYELARATHGEEDKDEGTYISAIVRVIGDTGYPTEKHVPWDEHKVLDRMPVSAFYHAYDQRVSVKDYAILEYGSRRIDAVKRALASGHPVVIGTEVDDAFLYTGLDWMPVEILGPSIGGHAMLLVGYEAAGAHVVNSWGRAWGRNGTCLLGWQTITNRVRDFRAIEAVRVPTS